MAVMPTTVPASGAPLPTPPSTSDPSNFDVRADAFFSALPGLQTSENLLVNNVYTNATGAYANALEVANNTASVAANTALTASYAGASAWVSGTTYILNDVRFSPIDRRLYRRVIAGAGTTDPSLDITNWNVITPAQAAVLISGLVQQAVSGSTYAFSNVATQGAVTNLLLYSSQFDQATWGKTSATVSADFTMSPTGDVNADKIVEVVATAAHFVYQNVTTASNQPYNFSVMLKAAGRTSSTLQIDDGAGTNLVRAKYDLTTGVVTGVVNGGTGSGAAGTSTYMGNGWWLCGLSGTCSSANSATLKLAIGVIDFNSNIGDGTSGVCVAQAQLETGSVYTSRIDTGAAQVVRASGVIAPSRLVLPASPANDAYVSIFTTNGIDTNVVDGNGQTIMGDSKPMYIDSKAPPKLNFQFVNGSWRI